MPGHFGRGKKVLNRVINQLPLAFVDQRHGRSICPAPSSKFCRRWSGFRPTAFLSRTVVQGSVPHAVRLSPCQPTSTWQGENEVSPESADNWWCGVHAPTMGQLRAGAIVCEARRSLSGLRIGAAALWSGVLETRRFKGKCTTENLAAVPRGVAKRFELSKGLRETFPKLTTVTRDEAARVCCRQAP